MKYFLQNLFILLLGTQICSAQWVETSNGLPGANVTAFAVSGSNLFAGLNGGGVFLTRDDGGIWNGVNTGLTTNMVSGLIFNNPDLFAGCWGQVFRSTNLGTNWTDASSGIMGTEMGSFAVIGSNIFGGNYASGCFWTTDNGANWSFANSGLTNTQVKALLATGNNLFAGTSGGGVFLSTNNASSWSANNNGLTDLYVKALAKNGTYMFAGTASGGIFRSLNGGANWEQVNNGLTNLQVNAFAVSDTNLFAGTMGGGVFYSSNNGENWIQVNTGMTGTGIVYSFAVKDPYIFAGSIAKVWRRLISDIITSNSEISDIHVPNEYTLKQNYPNPFNPSTIIKYSVPQASEVQIKVSDILGNEIETLVNEEKPVGTYEITWNAEDLTSGVYFYRLRAGSFIDTKKMILLK